MLHIDYNCKKCPSQELASVCAAAQESTLATVEMAATKDEKRTDAAPVQTTPSKPSAPKSFEKNVKREQVEPRKFEQPQLLRLAEHPATALTEQQSDFFSTDLDDRSIRTEKQIGSTKAKLLLPLLVLHLFSQTPGVGSSCQPVSQFVISKGTVASVPPSALKFS